MESRGGVLLTWSGLLKREGISSVELEGVVLKLKTGLFGVLKPSLMANVFKDLFWDWLPKKDDARPEVALTGDSWI